MPLILSCLLHPCGVYSESLGVSSFSFIPFGVFFFIKWCSTSLSTPPLLYFKIVLLFQLNFFISIFHAHSFQVIPNSIVFYYCPQYVCLLDLFSVLLSFLIILSQFCSHIFTLRSLPSDYYPLIFTLRFLPSDLYPQIFTLRSL